MNIKISFRFIILLTFHCLAMAAENRSENDNIETDDFVIESVRDIQSIVFTDTTLTTVDNRVYKIQHLPEDPALLADFLALSAKEKEQYYQRRNSILKGLIEKMDREKSINFLGRYITYKGKVMKLANRVVNFVTRRASTVNSTVEEPADYFKIGVQQIQELITKLEIELWKSSALIAEVNTPGRSIGLNGAIGLGIRKKGGMLNWALGIGYFENKELKKNYVEFYLIQEKFAEAFTYAAPSYLGLRIAWLNWRNEKTMEISGNVYGEGRNMPAALPYMYRSKNEFSMVSGVGLDALDLVVPMQTFAQAYKTTWHRRHFRIYFNSRRSKLECSTFYK